MPEDPARIRRSPSGLSRSRCMRDKTSRRSGRLTGGCYASRECASKMAYPSPMPPLSPLPPRYVADLFAPLHGELMTLLRGLAAADWERPTVVGAWRVRDIAAHLLDGDL